jgi:hypothetical protein
VVFKIIQTKPAFQRIHNVLCASAIPSVIEIGLSVWSCYKPMDRHGTNKEVVSETPVKMEGNNKYD